MLPRGAIRKVNNNGGTRPLPRTKHVVQAPFINGRSCHWFGRDASTNSGSKEPGFAPAITNGYGTMLPGRPSQMAVNMSTSMESGSMDSPSLGSESVMIHAGTNSVDAMTKNVESLGDDMDSPDYAGGKRKRGPRSGLPAEKGGRGLRHFSMKVCEKVESKGRTTYNEVADELVAEFMNGESILASPDQQQYDEKNIRRRVYDALNVLMAMEIISKEKKEIQWRGLPSTEIDDIEPLKAEHMQVRARIEEKAAYLRDLEEQIVGIQNLIERNETLFHDMGTVPGNGVALPFILVQTRPHATVEVEISEDMQLVHFDFNDTPFKLHDDAYVLKAMRLPNSSSSGSLDPNGGHVVPSDFFNTVEEGSVAALYRQSLPHGSPHGNMTGAQGQLGYPNVKASSALLPLPGILKARVKQEIFT